MKTFTLTGAATGLFFLVSTTLALGATGQYDNLCAMGLATGQEIQTDCSINADIGGKMYCFGSKAAKTEFMKDPEGNLAKADATYSKMKH
ncbi:hypothetical protein V6C03_08995 [Methyloligella sp. 2.7D]|uniref:hypothetical protein n=1 Tax=unclassified Methyloligella TaxID=2625955 RepID=UPI00157BEE2E|nr:hypothetical protein [Methyloligella sp. GL2]QKP78002.1 hypothetical protein HT051_11455 [Methyloligella sp. GL2]